MIIPESDWKKFKPLRDKALARLCDRILSEIAATSAAVGSSLDQTQHGDGRPPL